jgi:20S proteasome alpha/beta subunit
VALVAQSGSATLSGRAVEILIGMAKNQQVADYRVVADIAQNAMRQLKNELRFQQGDCTMEELRDYILKNESGCELMLAYYFENKPFLFKVDLVLGVATKINSYYAAIGCGGNLGEYLLSEYSKPNMDFNSAFSTAIYVVEEVKKHDAFCSGDARIGFIQPSDPPVIMDQNVINSVVRGLTAVNEAAKEDRSKKISEMLKSIGETRAKKYEPATTR